MSKQNIADGQRRLLAAQSVFEARMKDFEAALMIGSSGLISTRRDAVMAALEGVLDNKAFLIKKCLDDLDGYGR